MENEKSLYELLHCQEVFPIEEDLTVFEVNE